MPQRRMMPWRALTCSLFLGVFLTGCNDRQPAKQTRVVEAVRNSETAAHPLLGDWLRVDDQNEGAIVRFEERSGAVVGTLIFPGEGLSAHGFQTGQIKIRDPQPVLRGGWSCRSRVQEGDGWGGYSGHWYRDSILEMSDEQFFLRGTDRLESQRWVRLQDHSLAHANLLFGLFELHEIRGDYERRPIVVEQILASKADLSAEQLNDLSWELATAAERRARLPKAALELAVEACRQDGFNSANYLDTLAAAHASVGNWEQAVKFQQQACEESWGIDGAEKRLHLFQTKTAYHQGMDLSELQVATSED